MYVVLAFQTEHWVSEGVCSLSVDALVGKRHNGFFSGNVGCHIVLVAEVVKVVEAQLLVGQLYRTAVYSVIDSVVCLLRIAYRIAVHISIDTSNSTVLADKAVSKVDDLAHLVFLEQSRITLTIYLLYLPAYRRQHQYILTSSLVWNNYHALTISRYCGLVAFSAWVLYHILALCAVRVSHFIYQERSVVAFQCQHHLQRIAEVVL